MDIYHLIDQIHLQHLEQLDDEVNNALGSDDVEALFVLGETLYQYGLVPQGLKVFERLYSQFPDETELLVYYVEGLIDENKMDDALEVLHRSQLSVERLMLEADLYQQQDMMEVAMEKLKQAESLAPDDLIITFALAELLYYDGQYLPAARRYETLLNSGETDVNQVNIYSRIADAMLQSGDYEEAEAYYSNIESNQMTSDDYFKKAIALQKNDHLPDAIQTLVTLLDKDPDYMQAYLLLVNLYEAERMYDEAIVVGQKGIQLNEFFKELMVDTARIMLRKNDRRAEDYLIQALTIDPAYTEAAILLSDYYKENESYDKMFKLFSMLDEDDIDPAVKWNLAYSYQQEERDKEAKHFYAAAYEDLGENIDFLHDYYDYLVEIREDASAVEQQLTQLNPDFEPYDR